MKLHRRAFLRTAGAGLLAAPFYARVSHATEQLHRDVGQMLILGFTGNTAASALAANMRSGLVGGAIFLGHNIGSRSDVLALTSLFIGTGTNPLLAIDHEGGAVQRLSTEQSLSRLPSALQVRAQMDTEAARHMYANAGTELRTMGFNFNLAPVVDLHADSNPIIGRLGRAYSDDPRIVAAYGAAAISGFNDSRMLTSIKHFPGHGRSAGDTHNEPVDITRSWASDELEPFRLLIAAQLVESVMVGHLIHRQHFMGTLPASLSPVAIQSVLRGSLRYDGVVITDDLDMAAIRSVTSLEGAVVQAVAAGNDLLLLSNTIERDNDLPVRAIDWIAAAVNRGDIPRAQISQSAARIQQMKARRFGNLTIENLIVGAVSRENMVPMARPIRP